MAAIDDVFGAVRGAIAGLPSRVTADPVLRRNFEDEFDAVLQGLAERLQQTRVLYERAATLLRPVPRMSPTEWAKKSRQYPETAARPGLREGIPKTFPNPAPETPAFLRPFETENTHAAIN
jgi:hypothetical protein